MAFDDEPCASTILAPALHGAVALDFADPDELAAKIEESGLPDWTALWETKEAWRDNPEAPTIWKWKLVSAPTHPVLILERNPYDWKVDLAGNQLPYIDTLQIEAADSEVKLVRAIAGEIDSQTVIASMLMPSPTTLCLRKAKGKGTIKSFL